ncbi:carotenoid biosynthesis protein [Deinococcus apachensis]|uniref:carotenoid biosynthesis protein n=1 Tax=Deinococcus apachensis TaxID=309886 RepID=UPI00037B6C9C|nr:carotenoid biosynthesis protein [Deinococcus apachensis]
MTPTLLRSGLACAALGVAFLGALLVLRGGGLGWLLIALGLPLSLLLALAGDALGNDFGGTLRMRAAVLSAQMRPWMWLLTLYAVLKIPVPLWPDAFPSLALLSTGALFAAALAFAWERAGARRALIMAALGFAVGLGVEVLGSRTGFPFGRYSYAGAPGPTLLGVPLLVPLGWFALPLAAALLAGGRAWLAGLLLVAWDVGLEPLMTAQGYWRWSDPVPLWAGAPPQNFLGWWAVGTGLAWAFVGLAPQVFGRPGQGWGVRETSADSPTLFYPPDVERASLLNLSRLSFSAAYPVETFFLPGGLVLVGRYAEAAVTLTAMLAALTLVWAVRGRR